MSRLQNYLIRLYHKKSPVLKTIFSPKITKLKKFLFQKNKDSIKLICGLYLFYLLMILIGKNSADLKGYLWLILLFIFTFIMNILSPCFNNKNIKLIPLVFNTGISALIYGEFLPFLTTEFFSSSGILTYKLFFPVFLAIFCIQFFYTFIKKSLKGSIFSFIVLLIITFYLIKLPVQF